MWRAFYQLFILIQNSFIFDVSEKKQRNCNYEIHKSRFVLKLVTRLIKRYQFHYNPSLIVALLIAYNKILDL